MMTFHFTSLYFNFLYSFFLGGAVGVAAGGLATNESKGRVVPLHQNRVYVFHNSTKPVTFFLCSTNNILNHKADGNKFQHKRSLWL